MRVGDPEALARWVLRNRPEWTEERIRNAMLPGSPQVSVAVDPPIPVYITFLTAMVGENGELSFFDDLYGHDQTLHAAIAARTQGRADAMAAAALPANTPADARVVAAGGAVFAANLSTAQVSSGDALRQSALAE